MHVSTMIRDSMVSADGADHLIAESERAMAL